jgi:hypothetical protein
MYSQIGSGHSLCIQQMHIRHRPPCHHLVTRVYALGEEVGIGKVNNKVLVIGPPDDHLDVRSLLLNSMHYAMDDIISSTARIIDVSSKA